MAENNIIVLQNLSKKFGFMSVLKSVDLKIQRGQFVALLGSNGSGKSTLLRLIAGLTKPSGGTISVGGWQIPQEMHAVRHQVGMVSHKSLLYPTLTAYENLAFFATLYDVPEAQQKDLIMEILDKVNLKKRANSLVRTFSRGMQQRLSIARALLHKPHVLLFDEPHTGLDQDSGRTLDELLKQSHADGHTIIMTTHHLDRVPHLAQRAVILHKGIVALDLSVQESSASDLLQHYTQITGEIATP
jgi:heme exporter protein A